MRRPEHSVPIIVRLRPWSRLRLTREQSLKRRNGTPGQQSVERQKFAY